MFVCVIQPIIIRCGTNNSHLNYNNLFPQTSISHIDMWRRGLLGGDVMSWSLKGPNNQLASLIAPNTIINVSTLPNHNYKLIIVNHYHEFGRHTKNFNGISSIVHELHDEKNCKLRLCHIIKVKETYGAADLSYSKIYVNKLINVCQKSDGVGGGNNHASMLLWLV